MRVWRFSLYYVVTFGAYVALAAWLPKYYVDVYDQSLCARSAADRACSSSPPHCCGPSAAG